MFRTRSFVDLCFFAWSKTQIISATLPKKVKQDRVRIFHFPETVWWFATWSVLAAALQTRIQRFPDRNDRRMLDLKIGILDLFPKKVAVRHFYSIKQLTSTNPLVFATKSLETNSYHESTQDSQTTSLVNTFVVTSNVLEFGTPSTPLVVKIRHGPEKIGYQVTLSWWCAEATHQHLHVAINQLFEHVSFSGLLFVQARMRCSKKKGQTRSTKVAVEGREDSKRKTVRFLQASDKLNQVQSLVRFFHGRRWKKSKWQNLSVVVKHHEQTTQNPSLTFAEKWENSSTSEMRRLYNEKYLPVMSVFSSWGEFSPFLSGRTDTFSSSFGNGWFRLPPVSARNIGHTNEGLECINPVIRGTPKWMVYNGKAYQNGWFGNTHIRIIDKSSRDIHDIHLHLKAWKIDWKN